MGVDRAAAQAAGAADDEAVVGGLDVGAEAAQAVDDGRDPVGLLDAQLLRAGDDRLALGEAAEQRDQRQLVDRQRHLVRLDGRADQRAGGDVELGHRLLGGISPGAAVSRSPMTTPPIRSTIRTKPVRVQFALMSVTTIREPLTRIAAAMWNAADDGSPGTWIVAELELVVLGQLDPVAVAGDPAAGAGEQALGVVAARLGLDHRRRAGGQQPRHQHARLDLRRGHRQRVLDPAQRHAVHAERREAVVAGPRSRRPSARSGRGDRSTGRRRIDSSPSKVHSPPGWPASQPGASRISVPALPTSMCASAAARSPGAADRQRARIGALLDQRAEPRTALRVEWVSAASR